MERFGQASTEYIIVLGVLLAVGLAAVAIVSMNYQGQGDNVETIGDITDKQQPLTMDVIEAYYQQSEDPPPYGYYLYLELTNKEAHGIALRSIIINATKPGGGIEYETGYYPGTDMGYRWNYYDEYNLTDLHVNPGETLCFGHGELVPHSWPTPPVRQPNCPQRALIIGSDSQQGLVGECDEDPEGLYGGICDNGGCSGHGSILLPDVAIEYTAIGDSYEIVKRRYFGDIRIKCYGVVPQ